MLVVANIVVAAASGVFAIVGLVRPDVLMGRPVDASPVATYFAGMYAVRAGVLAVVVVAMAWRALRGAVGGLAGALAVAGAVQLGDVAVAVVESTPGAVGASVAAIVHLGSLVVIVRWRHRMPAARAAADARWPARSSR